MASQFFADCTNGHPVLVELFQAGTTVTCPQCNVETRVPDTVTLKLNSGDKYPLLVPIDKIRKQIEAFETPFDGNCVECNTAIADVVIPIIYRSLTERQLDSDAWVKLGLTGIHFTASGGQEYWDVVQIPLYLCRRCCDAFDQSQRILLRKRRAFSISLVLLLIGFLILCYYQFELVAGLSGLLWLIGLIAWAKGLHTQQKVDPALKVALEKINWLQDAVNQSPEVELSIGQLGHTTSVECADLKAENSPFGVSLKGLRR